MQLAIDTIVGDYRLEERLDTSSTSKCQVWRASCSNGHGPQTVAIKFLSQELAHDRREAGRFIGEAKNLRKLDHPNIIQVYGWDVFNERMPYYTMQYLGQTLRDYLDMKRQLPVAQALEIASQLAQALDACHAERIVHRDVKPQNIGLEMLPNGSHCVRLFDFGIAKVENVTHTIAGNILGTPHYMSTEQIEGTKELDGRSDQYSMAVVLWEVLTGQVPYAPHETQWMPICRAHLEHPLPILNLPGVHTTDPQFRVLDSALRQALDKKREHRFATCCEFIQAAGYQPICREPRPDGRGAKGGNTHDRTEPAKIGLKARDRSADTVRLNWSTDHSKVRELRIERALSSDGPFTAVADLGSGISEFEDTGLQAETTYFYRIGALDASGTSITSGSVSVTTRSGSGGNVWKILGPVIGGLVLLLGLMIALVPGSTPQTPPNTTVMIQSFKPTDLVVTANGREIRPGVPFEVEPGEVTIEVESTDGRFETYVVEAQQGKSLTIPGITLTSQPDGEAVILQEANALLRDGQFAKAAEKYVQLTEMRPENEIYWLGAADCYYQLALECYGNSRSTEAGIHGRRGLSFYSEALDRMRNRGEGPAADVVRRADELRRLVGAVSGS